MKILEVIRILEGFKYGIVSENENCRYHPSVVEQAEKILALNSTPESGIQSQVSEAAAATTRRAMSWEVARRTLATYILSQTKTSELSLWMMEKALDTFGDSIRKLVKEELKP